MANLNIQQIVLDFLNLDPPTESKMSDDSTLTIFENEFIEIRVYNRFSRNYSVYIYLKRLTDSDSRTPVYEYTEGEVEQYNSGLWEIYLQDLQSQWKRKKQIADEEAEQKRVEARRSLFAPIDDSKLFGKLLSKELADV